MNKTLSFILAITVLARLCDAICDPISFDSLPQARVPTELRSKEIEIINNDNNTYLCRDVDCRVMSNQSLASRLCGTFSSVNKYAMQSGLHYVPTFLGPNGTSDPCSYGIVTDGDYCCPTTRYCTCFNTTQVISNPQSQPCLVIALPKMIQCVTSAACCGGGTCSAQSSRSCKLESSMQSLFVWNVVSGQLQFEMFKFPAYCACKSN